MKNIIFCILLSLLPWQSIAQPDQIILFRHAEKMTGTNPHLTQAGKNRAKKLSAMLSTYMPNHLFSTPYHRTQQTIAPLAEKTQLTVQNYDPRALSKFAKQVASLSGTVIVAGHSNTTPQLIKLLSGHLVTITEHEFDKVFILTPTETNWRIQQLSSN